MSEDTGFETMLDSVLQDRLAAAPAGLEQRLTARFAQETAQQATVREASISRRHPVFGFAESVRSRRSARSIWAAVGLHAAVMLLIAAVVAAKVRVAAPAKLEVLTLVAPPPLPPPAAPRQDRMGGGGGQHNLSPASQGRMPKLSTQQIVPPKTPSEMAPKLPVEPSVVVQKDLKMAENTMPNLGLPNSTLKGISMGNGSGTGIGSGSGSGAGPGDGGNTGGGLLHAGGVQQAPKLIFQVDPEFSDEARRSKYSADVQVYLVVDEQGMPTHVRVARGAGMGLDEKAVEAVRQYRFKPAKQDGKAVKVDLYIDVRFDVY